MTLARSGLAPAIRFNRVLNVLLNAVKILSELSHCYSFQFKSSSFLCKLSVQYTVPVFLQKLPSAIDVALLFHPVGGKQNVVKDVHHFATVRDQNPSSQSCTKTKTC